jgi:seryl-tRNA synthetase
MLDINFVRDNYDQVMRKLQTRRSPTEVLDRFNQLETERRSNIRKVDELKAVEIAKAGKSAR